MKTFEPAAATMSYGRAEVNAYACTTAEQGPESRSLTAWLSRNLERVAQGDACLGEALHRHCARFVGLRCLGQTRYGV